MKIEKWERPTCMALNGQTEGFNFWVVGESVRLAINYLKNNKATGLDETQAELLKSGGEELTRILHKLENEI